MNAWKRTAIAVAALGALGGYFAAVSTGPSLLGADGPKTATSNASQPAAATGSPAATATIDGRYLPNQPPNFGGQIDLSAKDSKPWWPPRVVPPKGAPNVLLIMTDDAGYGVSSTFGGVIPTPAMDRVAKAGLRYTQFHSTALCSPTRAALITGRNHHSVGFGVVTEQSTGYPGYDSIIGPDNGTIGAILKQNGYATSWFGKEHNTPSFQYSIAGPFDQWPVGMGFEYFYGFMGGETDQWTPYFKGQFTWDSSAGIMVAGDIWSALQEPGSGDSTIMADPKRIHTQIAVSVVSP
jgi:arylsulfatase